MTRPTGTIRDVARETGLSIATVSRAMTGSAKVSPDARKRVLEASKRLHYFPNPAAKALSTNRTRTVAAIIPTIEHSVFAKFVAAIESTLGASGYSLVLAISNADPAEEYDAARKLLGMGAEAFILSGADHSAALLDFLSLRRVPHVFTSVWDENGRHPTIGYDNRALARQALQYLGSMGHDRVAVVHGPRAESDRTAARLEGALSARSDVRHLVPFETGLSVAGGKAVVTDILAHSARFTAVLCFSDVLALGVYFGLAEAGKSIPGDVSVMGFDNLDWAKDAVPALTTLDLPASGMGQAVAAQIVECLENETPLERLLLPARIISRASVAARK